LAVNVSQRNDASIVTYSELITMDGHVAFHKSSAEMAVKIAVVDIGINELTNNAITYTLETVGASGIAGSVEYHERLSGLALVKVILTGTVLGTNHPVAIYQNNITTGGAKLITLQTVPGSTGISKTHVFQQDGGTAISYQGLLQLNSHILIETSETDATVAAQVNVGSNG